MSIYQDIQELKKLFEADDFGGSIWGPERPPREAKPIFKAASKEQIAKRREQTYVSKIAKKIYDKYKWSSEDFRSFIGNKHNRNKLGEELLGELGAVKNTLVFMLEDEEWDEFIYALYDLADRAVNEDRPIFKAASQTNLKNRTDAINQKLAVRKAPVEKIMKERGVIKDAASDATFDDFSDNLHIMMEDDPDMPALWTQVCDRCARKFKLSQADLDMNNGMGICGVVGCGHDADHYYDFNTIETLPGTGK